MADEPQTIQLPASWLGLEETPILFANVFTSQFDVDLQAHLVLIGQVAPPPLVGTPEEVAEQAQEIDFVSIRPIVRLAITPSKMLELIQVLQANVDQREQVAKLRPGDPRDD